MQSYVPVPQEFADIAPYDDSQFHEKMQWLLKQPDFDRALRYVMSESEYEQLKAALLTVDNQSDFQTHIMGRFLEMLVKRTSAGLSCDGTENIDSDKNYTFITNHRDIVLDASFLNLNFIRNNLPVTQVAIGNNLLIYDWITDLVKLNRSFIVKRDNSVRNALAAARQLSGYIHYVINQRHESVWIAQREGRAKDSNDITQESLIKMMALEPSKSTKENLLSVNLTPVSISYEYDPNDYLKAREFLLRRRDPDFKKSQHDDLFSMETGILKYKGRIHMHIGKCLNPLIADIDGDNRLDVVRHTCTLIDRSIHCGYMIFPCNYIAFDEAEHTSRFANHYTADDVEQFSTYINRQLDRVDIPDVTPDEREFMRSMMLDMYANPLRNQLLALDSCRE